MPELDDPVIDMEAVVGAAPKLSVDEVMTEATLKRAAALAASGVTAVQTMAKALGTSNHFVRKIQTSDRFKQLVEEIGNSALESTKQQLKSDIARLGKKAIKAIEANLDKNSLEAARTVLRAMGVETAPQKDGDDKGGITLILAGQKPEPKKADVVVVREEDKQ